MAAWIHVLLNCHPCSLPNFQGFELGHQCELPLLDWFRACLGLELVLLINLFILWSTKDTKAGPGCPCIWSTDQNLNWLRLDRPMPCWPCIMSPSPPKWGQSVFDTSPILSILFPLIEVYFLSLSLASGSSILGLSTQLKISKFKR